MNSEETLQSNTRRDTPLHWQDEEEANHEFERIADKMMADRQGNIHPGHCWNFECEPTKDIFQEFNCEFYMEEGHSQSSAHQCWVDEESDNTSAWECQHNCPEPRTDLTESQQVGDIVFTSQQVQAMLQMGIGAPSSNKVPMSEEFKLESHWKHAALQPYNTSTWEKLHIWIFHLESYFGVFPNTYPNDTVKV